uniref:Rpn family recombination-promoting nuclease/putative transposase n=1 Tax=Candidatus Kentrum sp. LFY TaxID=2126342 RepID=A0A450WAQ1_9GAMM|nr:MAG: conserved hypothetical protein (putative transposase or invertase) [Candidatus Kentron sp. LFY]
MPQKPVRKIITFDWAIKTILRDKANFDVLEGFLSALFLRPITILDMLESESNPADEADKYNRVDLLAKTRDGERIIVEVQYLPEKAYLKRLAFGAAKTIVENLKLGEPYDHVKKVYSVSLVYFDVSRERDDDYIYHGKTDFTGLHTRRPVRLKDSLVGDRVRVQGTDVFPEYYLISVKRFPDIVRDNLDEWVWAFKHNEVPDEFAAPGIDALKDKFDYIKMSEEERRRFDAYQDHARSEWGTITHAREEGLAEGIQMGREEGLAEGVHMGREEGLAEGVHMGREKGLAEGVQMGKEEGLEEGIKHGREEGAHERSLEIARALKKEGWPLARIAEVTGISPSQWEEP